MSYIKSRIVKIIGHRRLIINWILLGVFVVFFLRRLFFWLPKDVFGDRLNLWVLTDWLIDYSSGFTRRGLSGELFNLTATIAQPRAVVGMLSWIIYTAVLFGYILLLTKSLKLLDPIILIGLLFFPSLLLFYIYDHDAFGRKETLGYLILLFHLLLIERTVNARAKNGSEPLHLNKYIHGILFISIILLPVLIFIHEGLFFLFVPVHVIMTFSILRINLSTEIKRSFLYTALIYLPAVLAFIIIVFFGRPTLEVAVLLCKKWELAGVLEKGSCTISSVNPMWTLTGAFTPLSWSVSQAAANTLGFSIETLFEWFIDILILGLPLIFIVNKLTRSIINYQIPEHSDSTSVARHSAIYCIKYFIIPSIISLPVYILGSDIGRWFSISCINFAMIGLSPTLQNWEFGINYREAIGNRMLDIPKKLKENINPFNIIMIVLIIIIIFDIRLPHCCNNGMNMLAGPLQSLIERIGIK